jgi:hypothetical protein
VSPNPGTPGPAKSRPVSVECSARGCRNAATWALVWNNPRVHTPEREKIWTACDEHRPSLEEHLGARAFLRRVDPMPGDR